MRSEHILWYDKPASVWTEALPLGNGRIGAMVFGGVGEERYALNEDTLWSGYPRREEHEGGPEALAEARRLIDLGDLHAAQKLIEEKLTGHYTEAYMPLGDLLVERPAGDYTDYRRQLDLSTGVHNVSYTLNGARHTITTFVVNPEPQAMVVEHCCDRPGCIDLTLRLACQLKHEIRVTDGMLTMETECPGHACPSYLGLEHPLIYSDKDEERGVRALTALLCEIEGGQTTVDGDCIRISHADRVTLKLCVRTSFAGSKKHPFTEGADYVGNCRKDAEALKKCSYETLMAAHLADFAPYMERVDFRLDAESDNLPTDRRLEAFAENQNDPRLYELLYNYGRYLTVSASRPGTQATNLQGIWNESTVPPWSSNYTVNINTEMNYYPAEIANLSEMHFPMFDLIEKMAESGKETAKTFYNLRGSACHHNTDLWGRSNPVGEQREGSAVWAFWPMALVWMCRDLYDHYLYTLDETFLRDRALPVLREATRFCLDFLTEDENGLLRVYPATSPENTFQYQGKTCSVAKSSACSNALIRELFRHYLSTLEKLGIDETMGQETAEALRKLRPYEFGSKGQLLEWDAEYEETDPHHRHTSHLVGLYPGHEIDPLTAPELADGARRTLELRGDDGTGWSLGWKICFWARLNDGTHALRLLKNQLRLVRQSKTTYVTGGGTYPNLFGAHPPFQIDGNFGTCAGISEMFLRNLPGEIRLLPALPDEWKNGSVSGLKAMGNVTVSLSFRDGKLDEALLDVPDSRALPIRVLCGTDEVRTIDSVGTYTIRG